MEGKYLKKRIALIDDDKEFLDELSDLLRSQGFLVDEYCQGGAALSDMQELVPDLVIVDLKLKDITGFKVIEGLKQKNNLQVIAMTGFYTEKEYEKLMPHLGVEKVLTKDFSKDTLLAEIRKSLGCNR